MKNICLVSLVFIISDAALSIFHYLDPQSEKQMNDPIIAQWWLRIVLIAVFIISASIKWIPNSTIATSIMLIFLFVIYGYGVFFSDWLSNCGEQVPGKERMFDNIT